MGVYPADGQTMSRHQENERRDKKRTIHERKQKRAFLTEEERSGKGSQDSGVKALTIAIQKTTPTCEHNNFQFSLRQDYSDAEQQRTNGLKYIHYGEEVRDDTYLQDLSQMTPSTSYKVPPSINPVTLNAPHNNTAIRCTVILSC